MNATALLESERQEIEAMEPIVLRIGGPESFQIIRAIQRVPANGSEYEDLQMLRNLARVLATKFQGEPARIIAQGWS